MNEKYLIINANSSSLKFSLYEMPDKKELLNGNFEKIGNTDSSYTLKFYESKFSKQTQIPNHEIAIKIIFEEMLHYKFINATEEIKGIGHRIVYGGEFYSDSVEITEDVINNVESLTKFAPLHITKELACIKFIKKILPNTLQVGVFDTAFHQTIPDYNYIYNIPYDYYKKYGISKYVTNGISHKYITETIKNISKREDVNIIICHLDNKANVCSVKEGKSFDTSMEITPLEGLIMRTRSKSIDYIVKFISEFKKISNEETIKILNTESGLNDIAGENDIRDLITMSEKGNYLAKLAIEIFVNSITKYISGYFPGLNGQVDAIILTAGVGESSKEIREMIINKLSSTYNIELNKEENDKIGINSEKKCGVISNIKSKIPVFVIPTNEESIILEDTYNITKNNIKTKKLTPNR